MARIAYRLTQEQETLEFLSRVHDLRTAIRGLFATMRKNGIPAKIIRKSCGCRYCGCKACDAEQEMLKKDEYLFTNTIDDTYAYIHKGEFDADYMRRAFDDAGLVCRNWERLGWEAFRVELKSR